MKRPVFLVGMMGAGKSTLGRILAEHLSLPFLDADDWVESTTGKSISELFEVEGEDAFRRWEQQFLLSLSPEPKIIATGGGLPCFHGNMERMKQMGTVVYLQLPVQHLFQRLTTNENRPLLKNVNGLEQTICELLERRNPIYEKAHLVLQGDQSLDELVQEFLYLQEINIDLF
jgi:shikimate kinase